MNNEFISQGLFISHFPFRYGTKFQQNGNPCKSQHFAVYWSCTTQAVHKSQHFCSLLELYHNVSLFSHDCG